MECLCKNALVITGSTELLTEFEYELEYSTELKRMVRVKAPEMETCDKRDPDKWGGKLRKGNQLTYSFETVDEVPTRFVCEVSTLFPDLEFELIYMEPMRRGSGFLRVRNGKFLDREHLNAKMLQEIDSKIN